MGKVMAGFDTRIIRHSDTEVPRYSVEFIGDKGESVIVECEGPETLDVASREQLLEHARGLARNAGSMRGTPDTPRRDTAS